MEKNKMKEKRENMLSKEKSIVKKKKNIIMRHKFLFFICFCAFVALVILLYIFFSLFVGSNDPYGDRLKGINSVKITNKEKKEVEKFLTDKEEVTKASVRVQGKIIYVHIQFGDSVGLDKAKEISSESLGKFSDDEKKFYDMGYFLRQDKEDGFYVTGNKYVDSDNIFWIKS